MDCNRRFVITHCAASLVAVVSPLAVAQAKHVDEADETAVALGYKHDTKLVDGKKYPKHAVTQHCGNCSFWQAKKEDEWGGCAMFGRKQVANAGWCQSWMPVPG